MTLKKTYRIDLTLPLLGVAALLAILKLTLFPGLSWWWVTAPVWIIPALVIALFGLILGVWVVVSLFMLATGRPVRLKYTWKRKTPLERLTSRR